jgi:hypothetical protein
VSVADGHAAPLAGQRGRRVERGRHAIEAAWPLALYMGLSLVFWGPWVLDAPRSTLLAANDIDPSVYLWFYSWWPHALLDGLNPFDTQAIFAPDGYNLAWVTSMPGPSVVLAPVTLALGPVATFNLIAFAAPALASWTAFLLCRHVGAGTLPGLVGGYLFGFSPYMLGALTGAPQLALVALVPVFALLTLRHVEGSLPDRRFVIAMTAALAAQIYLSTEVLATAALFGGLTLVGAYLLAPELRAALRRTIVLLSLSLAATALLAAPLLYYVLFESRTLPEHALAEYPADLLSFAVPSALVAMSPERFGATIPAWAAGSTYFGLPLLGLVAAFAWSYRRRLSARVSVIAFLLAAIAALGSALHVGGTKTAVPLPWKAFAELPFLRYAIPLRFSAFAFLAAAVIVGLWLTWRPSGARFAVVLVVLVSLVPALGSDFWHVRISDPPFFTGELHERFLDADDRVLTIPTSGRNMRWQARADFSFRMAAGYVGQDPRSYTRFPIWRKLVAASARPETARPAATWRPELIRFVEAKGVTVILADAAAPEPLRRLFGSLVRPVEVGRVLLYRLAPAS